MMMAEMALALFPKILNLHSFEACIEKRRKKTNWEGINCKLAGLRPVKVFEKMGFSLHKDLLEALINSEEGAIFTVLDAFYKYADVGVSPTKKSKTAQPTR